MNEFDQDLTTDDLTAEDLEMDFDSFETDVDAGMDVARRIAEADGLVLEGGPPADDEPPETEDEGEEPGSSLYGTFHIGGTEYSLTASCIREVVPFPKTITPLPLSPEFILGIFNLRGELIPVLDVAQLLERDSEVEMTERRVVVVDCGGRYVGAIFDRTGEVLHVDEEQQREMQHEQELGIPMRENSEQEGKTTIVDRVLLLNEGERLVQVLSTDVLGAVRGIPVGRLSQDREVTHDTEPRSKAIAVRVGKTEYAFPVEDILEIQFSAGVNPAPAYFQHQAGVVEVRGSLRPVLNLRSALGQADDRLPPRPLLISLIDGDYCIAVVVDALIDTLEFAPSTLLEVPPVPGSRISGLSRELIQAGPDRNVLCLRAKELFAHCEVGEALRVAGLTRPAEADEEVVEDTSEDLDYFTFFVGEQRLCLPLGDVREILHFPAEHSLVEDDQAPIAGLMNLRGSVLPLANLSVRFGIESTVPLRDRLVITIEHGDRMVGLVVDSVESIVRVASSEISEVTGIMRKTSNEQRLLAAVSRVIRPRDSATTLLVLDIQSVMDEVGGMEEPLAA